MKISKYGLNAIWALWLGFCLSAYMFTLTCHANAPKTQTRTSIIISTAQFQQLKENNDRLTQEFEMCKKELTTLKRQSVALKQQLQNCKQQLTTTSELLTKTQKQLSASNDDLQKLRDCSIITAQSIEKLKMQIDDERKNFKRTQKRLRWQGALKCIIGGAFGFVAAKIN